MGAAPVFQIVGPTGPRMQQFGLPPVLALAPVRPLDGELSLPPVGSTPSIFYFGATDARRTGAVGNGMTCQAPG